jgi:hypothetical protein
VTLWAFYRLVLKRGLSGSWGLTERVELALGIIAGAVQFFYPPTRYPLVGTILAILWIVPSALLLWTVGRALILAPYQVHVDTLAKIPNIDRAVVRDRLGQLLIDGEKVREDAECYGVNNFAEEILAWQHSVEKFLAVDLGKEYIARFRNIAHIDDRMIYDPEYQDVVRALKTGCNFLSDLIKEFS